MTARDGARKYKRETENMTRKMTIEEEICRAMCIIATVTNIEQIDTCIRIGSKYIKVVTDDAGTNIRVLQTYIAYKKLTRLERHYDVRDPDPDGYWFRYYRDLSKEEKILKTAKNKKEVIDYLATEVKHRYPSKAEKIDNALADMDAFEEKMKTVNTDSKRPLIYRAMSWLNEYV